ncbi:phage regulatory CII family protein [Jejubacter calystegiae]|uniref:Phage regulatory CII family protein n=1 Tax=Jejubacter calystegiae TaxID=2579935 RepID=A0A4P8YFH2_9ENTR|nr:phage regulatory CII family protein [Jejubacter calystegiae]QCT18506.1 phage regulatory CII family protein [Jejubacter calystegiae]
MFDYLTSKHAHFDAACRAFAQGHNLEELARAVGMRPQVLRNKLNPDQPHQLNCMELLAITDATEDARLLDGLLAQINCLPSVPVNNATAENLQICALSATADVGAIAGEAVSPAHMTAARRTAIFDRANNAIRNLSLLLVAVESRFNSTPVMAAAFDAISSGQIPGLM